MKERRKKTKRTGYKKDEEEDLEEDEDEQCEVERNKNKSKEVEYQCVEEKSRWKMRRRNTLRKSRRMEED